MGGSVPVFLDLYYRKGGSNLMEHWNYLSGIHIDVKKNSILANIQIQLYIYFNITYWAK